MYNGRPAQDCCRRVRVTDRRQELEYGGGLLEKRVWEDGGVYGYNEQISN